MNVEDVLARHRPADRLDPDERDRLLAVFGTSGGPESGSDNDVLGLVGAGGRPERPRRPWVPATAAAAVLLVCAGGLAAWRASDDRDTVASGGGKASSFCPATLPSSWDAARSDTPLQVDGHNAVPHASSPGGVQVLSWNLSRTKVAFGLRAANGAVTPVATFPAGDSGGPGVSGTDGRHVLFDFSPEHKNDILLVDAKTDTRVHLLARAPMPAGWVVRTDVAVLDGYVYWGATPGESDDSRGIVVRYSIPDRSYRVLARLDRFPMVAADIRGVAWPTGAVHRKGLPPALNPILDAHGNPVDRLVTDGRAYGWQLIKGDQTVFHWADSAGDTRTFRVAIDLNHDGAMLTAVSGPFLFFHVNMSGASESVLDTRTGALAHADGDNEIVSAPGQHLFAMAGGFEYHEVRAAALPGFGCR